MKPTKYRCSYCDRWYHAAAVDYTYSYYDDGYTEFVFCSVCKKEIGFTNYGETEGTWDGKFIYLGDA